jgi:hypothetical protein
MSRPASPTPIPTGGISIATECLSTAVRGARRTPAAFRVNLGSFGGV